MSRDPIEESGGSSNIYEYARNQPINSWDKLGLKTSSLSPYKSEADAAAHAEGKCSNYCTLRLKVGTPPPKSFKGNVMNVIHGPGHAWVEFKANVVSEDLNVHRKFSFGPVDKLTQLNGVWWYKKVNSDQMQGTNDFDTTEWEPKGKHKELEWHFSGRDCLMAYLQFGIRKQEKKLYTKTYSCGSAAVELIEKIGIKIRKQLLPPNFGVGKVIAKGTIFSHTVDADLGDQANPGHMYSQIDKQ